MTHLLSPRGCRFGCRSQCLGRTPAPPLRFHVNAFPPAKGRTVGTPNLLPVSIACNKRRQLSPLLGHPGKGCHSGNPSPVSRSPRPPAAVVPRLVVAVVPRLVAAGRAPGWAAASAGRVPL